MAKRALHNAPHVASLVESGNQGAESHDALGGVAAPPTGTRPGSTNSKPRLRSLSITCGIASNILPAPARVWSWRRAISPAATLSTILLTRTSAVGSKVSRVRMLHD